MKKRVHGLKFLALLVLIWGNLPIVETSATVFRYATWDRNDSLLAQSIVGQCRAANRQINIYRQPDAKSEIIGTVEQNQEVTLAEAGGRNGWIAINSPGVGFVQTQFLKPNCENSAPQEECRAVKTDTFIHAQRLRTSERFRAIRTGEEVTILAGEERNGWVTLAKPQPGFVLSDNLTSCSQRSSALDSGDVFESTLCRRFVATQPEEFVVYERPDRDSSVRGQLLPQYIVVLDSSTKFTPDSQGREWAKIVIPVEGWVSNGFPRRGGINLEACSQ